MASPTHTEIGRVYVSQHRHDVIYTRGQWHRYQGGVWTPVNDLHIEKEIWGLLEKNEQQHSPLFRPTFSIQKSVLNYAKAHLFKPEAEMDSRPNLINLANGVFNLEDGNLTPHRPDYYMTTQLPFAYDPAAISPTWLQYVESTFVEPQSTRHDPELAAFVQEAIGYSLTISVAYQITFWCQGRGANGKGILFSVLEALAGAGAVPLNLNLLRREQYQLADLAGKRIAFCTEANANDNLVEDATVKALVAGDTMKVRQIHREPFDLHPTVKLWWSMNHLPAVADSSDAFWRRIRLIPFNRQFALTERDIDLKEKLVAELPGIFNWAIEGLQRLQRNGRFTEPKQVLEATNRYRRESNVIQLFVDERCVVDKSKKEGATSLYTAYKEWALVNTYRPLSNRSFKREMESLGFYNERQAAGNFYTGLELKP